MRRSSLDELEFCSLNQEDRDHIERPFSKEEIYYALMSCKGDKTLVPNSFSVAFLQSNWKELEGNYSTYVCGIL